MRRGARVRFLSASQAADCENAQSGRATCTCRCGGELHGVNVRRAFLGQPLRPDTWDLEEDDPHLSRVPSSPDAEATVARLRSEAARLEAER